MPQTLQTWRERTLARTFQIIVLTALVPTLVGLIASIQRGQYLVLGLTAVVLAIGGVLAVARGLSYRLRTYSFLASVIIYGSVTLFNLGLLGAGRLHLLLAVFLAAVLLPRREVIAVWGLVAAVAVMILGGIAAGMLPLNLVSSLRVADPMFYALNTITFLWFIVAVGGAVLAIITDMDRSLTTASEAIAARDAVAQHLESLVEARTEDLRRSQALLQAMLDHSPVAIYVKDLEGRYLLTNRYMHQVHNLAASQMAGCKDLELFGVDAQPWREHERAVLAAGEPVAAEVITPHGAEPRIYYEIKFPLRDSAGAITAIGGIATDITERRKVEDDLARSNTLIERQRAYAEALSRCSTALLSGVEHPDPPTSAYLEALGHLQAVVGGLRTYLYTLSTDPPRAQLIAEVCAPGVTSDPRTAHLSAEVLAPPILAAFAAGEPVVGPIAAVLAASPDYRAVLAGAGIASVLTVPIYAKGALWGFLGFSDADGAHQWLPEDVQLVQTAAEMIAAFAQSHALLQTLRAREHFIQRVADASPDIIYIYDLNEQRAVYATRALSTILGYSPEEMQAYGANLRPILLAPAELAAQPQDQRRLDLLPDDEVDERSYQVHNKAGAARWLLSRHIIFARDSAGQPAQLLGVARDITEQREEQLQLAQREAQLRALGDNLPNGFIYQYRLDHQNSPSYTYLSSGVEQVLGVTAAAALADPLAVLGLVPPEDQAALLAAEARSLASFSVFSEMMHFVRGDGSERWLYVCSRPRREPDGCVIWDGVALDFTERHQVAEELARARDAAEAATRAKSAFLANMSHEIRTPLNAVIGMTALLQETELTDEQRVLAEIISTGSQALLTVISDILDFSRIESGYGTLETAPLDLPACLNSAADLVSHAARGKGLALTVTLDPSLPRLVVGDAGRLRQVLLNLLSNAVKFTGRGEVALRAAAAPHGDGSVALTIDVRDTGIGIDPAQLDQIFAPFVQAHSPTAERAGGTGLGLAISQQLVGLMGGSITVASSPGAGSTFTVRLTLPLAPATALAPPAELAAAPARPLRILVAEDNPINQEVVLRMIAHLGHEAALVADGLGAIAAVRAASFDVILMDLQMPGLDGEGATRRIRAMGAAVSQPRIIALTANVLASERDRLLQAGMDDYLSKPLDLPALREALARVPTGPDAPVGEQARA